MPFEERLPSRGSNVVPQAHIAVSVTSDGTKRERGSALAISLRPFIMQAMGWSRDTRVAFVEGYGADIGFVALRQHPGGYLLRSSNPGEHYGYIRIASNGLRYHVLTDHRMPPREALYETKGDMLMILLPPEVLSAPPNVAAQIARHRERMTRRASQT